MSDLMRTAEVAAELRVSPATVRWWRHVKTGPPSFKVQGAVRYRRADVEAWLAQQYEATNTAEGIA